MEEANSTRGCAVSQDVFGRDTFQLKARSSKLRKEVHFIEPKIGKTEKFASGEEVGDPLLLNLVNYHGKLVSAAGRFFDVVVGKLCHLLKTNGKYLEANYKDTLNELFFTIRTLILDKDKSELSRTRLLEILELKACSWNLSALESEGSEQGGDQNEPASTSDDVSPSIAQVTTAQKHPHEVPSKLSSATSHLQQQQLQQMLDARGLSDLALSIPLPDDEGNDEDEWETYSEVTCESDSSDEFVAPEMRDLMLESTSELDDELANLLASKIPHTYKRVVNDGKPVRYTRSFLLDCWRSPFSKEMPPVLRHTISHSDVSFIIERHAFSDPKELYKSRGDNEPLQLISLVKQRSHSIGRQPQDQPGRRRLTSWPQGTEHGQESGVGSGRIRYASGDMKQDSTAVQDEAWAGDRSRRNRYPSGEVQQMTPVPTGGQEEHWAGDRSRRNRYPSGEVKQMNVGAPTVQMSAPDAQDGRPEIREAPWRSTVSSSNVLLTPSQLQEAVESDHKFRTQPSPTDFNNNGDGHKRQTVPTFSQVFKEVIEKGRTATVSPPLPPPVHPPTGPDHRPISPYDSYNLVPAHIVPGSRAGPKAAVDYPAMTGSGEAYYRYARAGDYRPAPGPGMPGLGPQSDPSFRPVYGPGKHLGSGLLGPAPQNDPTSRPVFKAGNPLPYGMGAKQFEDHGAGSSYVARAK